MSSSDPMPSSFDGDSGFYAENNWERFIRRLKEEPLIPLGAALTVVALVAATNSVRAKDHHRAQRMFRARLYAQSFTVLAIVGGGQYWKEDRKKRKEFEGILKEKKAKEKQEAWIKELEARDDEVKREREVRGRRRAMGRGEEREGQGVRDVVGRVIGKGQDQKPADNAGLLASEKLRAKKSVLESVNVDEQKGKSVLDSISGLIWGNPKK